MNRRYLRRTQGRRHLIMPGMEGAQSMGREVGCAAVEGQLAPAPTEGRDPAVAVLQTEQPTHPQLRGLAGARVDLPQAAKRQERSGGVVGVGHAARQVGPGPAARRRSRVGVYLPELLLQKPLPETPALLRVEHSQLAIGCRQSLDRERRQPGRQIDVDRPAPVGARCAAEKLDRATGNGMLASVGAGQAHGHECGQRHRFEEPAA